MNENSEKIKTENQNIHGVKIQHFNLVIMVLTCIVYIILLSITINIYKNYNASIRSTQDYILCEQLAEQLRQGSDYLTEQVRLYAETGELQYANAYFEEANVTRRRDLALEQLMQMDIDDYLEAELSEALKFSNELMEIEFYSMRLIAEAYGTDMSLLPETIRKTNLSPADAALSATQKESQGRLLVFDDNYRDYKENIYHHLNILTDSVLSKNAELMNNDTVKLSKTLRYQRVMITLLFIMNLIMFTFIISMVIRPLKIYITTIQEEKLIDIVGSYECKYLALTYNNIYEINAANKAHLRYNSEHDKLTGLYNRRAFDDFIQILKTSSFPLAILIIDIDHFKAVNDTYGHATGDIVIRKVGQLLQESFRSEDKVIRYGGDEFVVIMPGITEENCQIIADKAEQINEALANPGDNLPVVSLSIGIAFSKHGYSPELFNAADKALYQAKSSGRCRYQFADKELSL